VTTMREYFEAESATCLTRLERLIGERDAADPQELYRLARALRGTAQMAREDRVYRAAVALEGAARAVARGSLRWEEDARQRVAATLRDLHDLVAATSTPRAQEASVAAVLERWLQIGVDLPDRELGRTISDTPAPDDAHATDAEDSFLRFAAAEVASIASILSQSVDALVRDPVDRAPLKAVLRRQRPLLGAARLDEIGVVAETLRAVEDLSRVIARLDVAVKDEWLDIFRCAREIMRAASDALDGGELPRPTNALSRLRTLHAEILERYGADEVVPADSVSDAIAAAQPATEAGPVAPELDIQELMYDRDEAVRRIMDLRARLERGTAGDPDARAALDELFDLLRHVLA